jgi:hypothetical protein
MLTGVATAGAGAGVLTTTAGGAEADAGAGAGTDTGAGAGAGCAGAGMLTGAAGGGAEAVEPAGIIGGGGLEGRRDGGGVEGRFGMASSTRGSGGLDGTLRAASPIGMVDRAPRSSPSKLIVGGGDDGPADTEGGGAAGSAGGSAMRGSGGDEMRTEGSGKGAGAGVAGAALAESSWPIIRTLRRTTTIDPVGPSGGGVRMAIGGTDTVPVMSKWTSTSLATLGRSPCGAAVTVAPSGTVVDASDFGGVSSGASMRVISVGRRSWWRLRRGARGASSPS